MEEVRARQSRPLDAPYPIVYLDAFMVKMLDSALEGPQLTVGKSIWVLFLELLKEIFGTRLRAGLELF